MSAAGAFAGANDPIGGVGIGLGHKPNPGAMTTRVTGPSGSIDLGVLPKGEYWVTLTPPKGASAATAGIKTAAVTISGATTPVKASWNFETSRPLNRAASAGFIKATGKPARQQGDARVNSELENVTTVQDSVSFTTDGTHHVVVVVRAQSTTVNSSRSNIRNNAHIYVTPAPTPYVGAQSTAVQGPLDMKKGIRRNNVQRYVTPSPTPTRRN